MMAVMLHTVRQQGKRLGLIAQTQVLLVDVMHCVAI